MSAPLLGQNATRLTTLDQNACYVMAIVLPNVVDAHTSLDSREKEFDIGDVMERHDFTGLPARLNHNHQWKDVGWVDGYRPGKNTEVLIRLDPSSDVESLFAQNALANGYYRGVSLGHDYTTSVSASVRGGLEVRKEGVEISFCSEGKREGSVISQYFPSLAVLLSQDRVGLQRFAVLYQYPEPPSVGADLQYASDVPELRAYVERALYPTVAQRRNDLLKSAGYIAASRHHRPNDAMSGAPTPASNSNAMNLDSAPPKPAAAATTAHTPTPLDANDPVAVMKAMAAELAFYKDRDENEKKAREAAEKAERDKKEADDKKRDDEERAKKHAWFKTQKDMLLAAGETEQADMVDGYAKKLDEAPSYKAFEGPFGKLAEMSIAAAKKAVESRAAQLLAEQQLTQREMQMVSASAARLLTRTKLGAANMSGSFAATRDPDADVDDKPRSKKRSADEATDELRSGTVEASRGGQRDSVPLTPQTRGWPMIVAMDLVQRDPDTGLVSVPTYAEIATGGKVFKGKVQRGPGGKDVRVLEQRFEESVNFGPQDMFPDFYEQCIAKLGEYRPSREEMTAMRTRGAALDPAVDRMPVYFK